MIYLRTEEWGLPKVFDRDLPEDCQYIHSIGIYRGYRCQVCGEIYKDPTSSCCCDTQIELVEIDINGRLIEEIENDM